jgi:diaminohydroxyphosphoribosylaminopyrimidine deaminase/5-amino-6-(5-phosphoribosylamino)uracil reductase
MLHHEFFMQRCLQLAELGQQWVAPNPMVGAVVVKQGNIIAEGYHQQYGGAHAEVNAINTIEDKAILEGATIYVSLEPCAHFGKTPPCTNLIIENKITKVVIACLDPNPLVAGKGVAQLKQAGVEVIVGVLEKEAKELNKRFIHFHTYKKPYVVLKWAQTEDGYCGRLNSASQSNKITNWYSDVVVHKMRSNQAAILVGYNTALNDNPQLTTRNWFGKNPIRVIIDLQCSLPQHLKIFTDGMPTFVFTLAPKQNTPTVSYFKLNNKEDVITEIFHLLYEKNIQSILVEGGPKTLQMFIDSNSWNEAHIFTSNNKWQSGLKAPNLFEVAGINSITNFNDTYKIVKPNLNL